MMNLRRIYEEIKLEYESRGIFLEDDKLRQLAWVKRDRMFFEKSMTLSSTSTSSAGSGGGSGTRRFSVDVEGILLTENNEIILIETGIGLSIE